MAQYTSISGVKLLILVLGLGFFLYILGPPLYWHFVGDEAGRLGTCPECVNECPDDADVKTALADLSNVTLPACPKIDTDMADELQKSNYKKLQEEMKLQKSVAEEAQRKSNEQLLDEKKKASQYQKEFEKCNSGMETSEGAREKAEQLLAQVKKTAALWEARAKELGWTESEKPETTKDAEEKLNSRETEEVSNAESEDKVERKVSKNGEAITRDLLQNLEVAGFMVQRAVENEFGSLKGARQQATEKNLL